MRTHLAWLLPVLAIAAGCGGSSGSTPPGTHVDCAWFAGANCWRASAAAATACTNGAAVGTFNGATTTCTYADGNVVQFDPSSSATASLNHGAPWSFSVLTPAATTCARFVDAGAGMTLKTSLGTFAETADASHVAITCPDGTQVWTETSTALGCNFTDLPGIVASGSSLVAFSLFGAPAGDTYLWKCQ